MGAKLVLSYNENRRGALFALTGSTEVYLSTLKSDVEAMSQVGINIQPKGSFLLTWILHQELCWYEWWATCNTSSLTVWEWFDIPTVPGECLSPVATNCRPWIDGPGPRKPEEPDKCKRRFREPCRRLRAYINQLKGGYNAQS